MLIGYDLVVIVYLCIRAVSLYMKIQTISADCNHTLMIILLLRIASLEPSVWNWNCICNCFAFTRWSEVQQWLTSAEMNTWSPYKLFWKKKKLSHFVMHSNLLEQTDLIMVLFGVMADWTPKKLCMIFPFFKVFHHWNVIIMKIWFNIKLDMKISL